MRAKLRGLLLEGHLKTFYGLAYHYIRIQPGPERGVARILAANEARILAYWGQMAELARPPHTIRSTFVSPQPRSWYRRSDGQSSPA